jgi:hypothetical protein
MTIGKIIAGDIVMNNPDRIPTMMGGKRGNSSNVMFEVRIDENIDEERYFEDGYSGMRFEEAMAIDNKCFAIIVPES